MPDIDLKWSPQQVTAMESVARWLRDRPSQVYRLFGFAGTGKTTLAKYLAEGVTGPVYFSAYTGKAASVLRKMGCPGASTIHSLIYSVSDQDQSKLTELQLEYAAIAEANPEDDRLEELALDIRDLKKKLSEPKFTRQEDSVLRGASLVVVDECSMIDKYLAYDLESFKVPLLVMGDPAQLPPVKGGAGYYNTRPPDSLLTEIHRQAAENPILRWSQAVREGQELPYADEGKAKKLSKKKVGSEFLESGGQLLAGKNDTRRKLNLHVRGKLGRLGAYPEAGDRLVVLRNDRDWAVLNGVTCAAATDAIENGEECVTLDLDYEDRLIEGVPVDKQHFDAYSGKVPEEQGDWQSRRWMLPMDYGYCLTVHKAQGSQWPKVTLCDDGFGKWDAKLRRQWLYTAITRAQEELVILT